MTLKPGESHIDFLMRNKAQIGKYLEEQGLYETKDIVMNILVGLKTSYQSFGYGFVIISGCGGCLTGDTEIRISRANGTRITTLKRLYNQFNGNPDKMKSVDRSIPTFVRSFTGEEIRLHKAEDVVYSGKKEVFELLLEDGKKIKATPEHKIMTTKGWVECKDLTSDDEVMTDKIRATPTFSKVKSVTPIGKEDTYDIECADPYHNFVANDIVVHNSGKTKIAKHMLEWLNKKLNVDFKLIATDENTSTDSLLARVSADSLMSQTGEKYVVGEMGQALNSGKHILWDEINRTPFENIQKMMTLLSEKEVEHRGMRFKIPDGTIILSTTNLGSKGTFPLAQEFKQRSSVVEVRYDEGQMKRVMYTIFQKDAVKVDLGMALYKKTVEYAKEGRNGWNYEASIRTVKTFVDRILIGVSFGLKHEEAVYQAIRSVLVQFTDESSVFIQRKNAEINSELEPEIKKIITDYNVKKKTTV